MSTMTEIEKATKLFSDARAELAAIVQATNKLMDEIRTMGVKDIRRAVAKTAERHDQLKTLIEGAPALFDKPRTVIFHGIKVGITKGKGSIEWDEDECVVKLIRKHLPDQFDALVKVTEKPKAKALKDLSVNDLRKIGCTVEETGDQVLIKAVDSEVEKAVNALLKAATEED